MLSAARRVLFVDDDRTLHRTVAKVLAGFEVRSAYDGPSALAEVERALAAHQEFGLVILDVGMPGWGGLETLERIWKVAPDVQALFCTGSQLEYRELADHFGETDAIIVIKKPFALVEIAQATHALTTKWQLQREARARLGELEAAVSARTAQLESANRRLAEELAWRDRVEADIRVSGRLEAVGQLAAGIAHEINNPLQYVGDHLEFVNDSSADLLSVVERIDEGLRAPACAPSTHASDPSAQLAKLTEIFNSVDLPYLQRELPGALEAIQDGIKRITSIVHAMKELSHPGTRDARVADINRAIESALEISANSYRGVADLEKRLSPLPPVTCFVAELGQVFLNLIVNAAHAMENSGDGAQEGDGHRGTLAVTSSVDGDHVVITVGDTGCGIPVDIQQRIFDPFFTTKEVGRGTGQGLAIARSIVVDRHGGSLSFNSVTGAGTTFVIRIPIDGPRPRQATAAA